MTNKRTFFSLDFKKIFRKFSTLEWWESKSCNFPILENQFLSLVYLSLTRVAWHSDIVVRWLRRRHFYVNLIFTGVWICEHVQSGILRFSDFNLKIVKCISNYNRKTVFTVYCTVLYSIVPLEGCGMVCNWSFFLDHLSRDLYQRLQSWWVWL